MVRIVIQRTILSCCERGNNVNGIGIAREDVVLQVQVADFLTSRGRTAQVVPVGSTNTGIVVEIVIPKAIRIETVGISTQHVVGDLVGGNRPRDLVVGEVHVQAVTACVHKVARNVYVSGVVHIHSVRRCNPRFIKGIVLDDHVFQRVQTHSVQVLLQQRIAFNQETFVERSGRNTIQRNAVIATLDGVVLDGDVIHFRTQGRRRRQGGRREDRCGNGRAGSI